MKLVNGAVEDGITGSSTDVLIEDGLYLASRAALLSTIRRPAAGSVAVMLTGYTPGSTDFAAARPAPGIAWAHEPQPESRRC